MDGLGGITAKKALIGIAVVIIAGGTGLGLAVSLTVAPGLYGVVSSSTPGGFYGIPSLLNVVSGGPMPAFGGTQVIGDKGTVASSGTTVTTTTTYAGSTPNSSTGNATQGAPSESGGLIEFSSQVTLESASPQQTASQVVGIAYSVGGYVAYQSTYPSSANLVIRVPAADYQLILAKVEALDSVQALTSNSNDVKVQYTDLNATLESLQAEQAALLRLLNQSTSINSTLAIESQLQGVNQQVNEVESQILQTRTLIEYATIQVTVTETAQAAPLSLSLTATPKSGQSPLSVTFNAVVKGGAQPYVVNYNFGDGFASQGQIVIHTYYVPGNYNVTVTVTDQNGTSAEQWAMVSVSAPPGHPGVSSFLGTISGLFVSVLEGITEVAVVVLPIAAVGAVVVIPVRRRARSQKGARQPQ